MINQIKETHDLYSKLLYEIDYQNQDSTWVLPKFIDFVLEKHKDQRDKYVDSGYYRHLAEVAALSVAYAQESSVDINLLSAIAWGHDLIEDQSKGDPESMFNEICNESNESVAIGILWLSDLESGARATRKELTRNRLSQAPSLIQTIKVCDMMTNIRTIFHYAPKFAALYVQEAKLLLDRLILANKNARMKLEKMLLSNEHP